ncbi:MAG: glycosyltransferase family 2 protein [Kiritimatiellia bacterium]|jgi:glycosyltransferase involved in cell wall biosynthesis
MPPPERAKISACVIVFNEERKIRRCLQSVTWCDEIIVMDSFSTDRTVEIAREFTPHVYQNIWLGYVGQRNLIREKATHDWILYLDSDEEVSAGLRDEILAEFAVPNRKYLGYEFPRLVFFLGRWIKHGEWYPDVKLRLFHKDYGRTEGEEPHDRVYVRGPVKRLKNPIFHYTYDDIRDQNETLNRFSTITAQQKFIKDNSFRWIDLIFRPFFRFFKGYILRLGFLDGVPGLIIALTNGYGAFLKYAKLWELQLRQRSDFREMPETQHGSDATKR